MSDARSPSQLSIGEIVETIRHILVEDEERGAAPTLRSLPGGDVAAVAGDSAMGQSDKAEDADDILELTQALNEDGSVRHLAPIGPTLRARLRDGAPPEAPADAEPSPMPAATPEPSEPPAAPDERRIANIASRAAAAPARAAAQAPPEGVGEAPSPADERAVDEVLRSLGAGDRKVEDIVRDLVQPLVQAWLEENLQEIVERQVRVELAKTIERPGF